MQLHRQTYEKAVLETSQLINKQIAILNVECVRMGIQAGTLRNTNGDWPMNNLLLAKVQVLALLERIAE
jgi:hypothetical protein